MGTTANLNFTVKLNRCISKIASLNVSFKSLYKFLKISSIFNFRNILLNRLKPIYLKEVSSL
ncbi:MULTISPECIES: hypothetical protein [Leptospira]|uniref:Uncharacterized protein n=2 Tax=Leptospira interrogans TaxID=173 RepID=A0AAV9FQN6_LEPIR|nr:MULTISPECIES: hypothetical protein [Leptospira]EJP15659.1 hypothetical protein LEP1GSC080_3895 [Leptospira interrogans str. FPW2026]EMM93230.1 hypothetical protein LEP1GSC158_4261 [Leptospira interrogans serovar Zanoni str. LT2156]KAK2617664.1 hypothetical protein CFV95_000855 [Leptospira interrogans]WOT10366.1 hypothetical protein CFY92_0015150 [Leptospira interrogans]